SCVSVPARPPRSTLVPYTTLFRSVEYSSPNTNKPLNLGHVRNNLLGHALSEVLKANGKRVVKTNIGNDRGIHICKSMLAWQKWGDRKSTRLNSSHVKISYAVFCLK